MTILTPEEKEFLDVFLHEATASPFFNGPATKALYGIGVEYTDISYIAWAYQQEVPMTSFAWGNAADVSPPLPWPNRQSALQRDEEIRRIWEQGRQGGRDALGQNKGVQDADIIHTRQPEST
jgi:hypothetical protein